MLVKFAKAEVLGVRSAPSRVRSASLNKFADFNEYRTDDGYVYVRVRAISSRVNKNHDGWPSNELKRAYRTFIGKPIFVDHHNSDPKKARGVIVDAALHIEDDTKTASLDPYYGSEGVDPAHLPPTWVELLLEVDAKKFPKLAKAIVSGEIDGVSMGANVEYSVCSHCGNTAHTPEEFCKHVISKGAYFDYHTPTGLKISKKSYENCHKIGFFEISFVFDPADETALVSEIKHEARRQMIAAIRKEGDELIDPNEAQVPNDPSGLMTEEEALQAPPEKDEFAQVVENRYRQLIEMGVPEEQARQIAEMEYRGTDEHGWDTGVDLHRMRDMIEQGATPELAGQILARKTAAPDATNMGQNPAPQSEMISAPDHVNTLRQEQKCPICGSDMEDGQCEVCNYEEPPEGMDNPDLEKAKTTDEELEQQQAQQAAQQAAPPQPGPGGPGGPGMPPPGPGAGAPALARTASNYFLNPFVYPETVTWTSGSSTGNVTVTSAVMGEQKTSAATNSGRINTQERPILPATRQLSDKPIDRKVIQEAKKPVESKTKDTMTQGTQKTAEGTEPGAPEFKADQRVDVLGIGGVDSDTDAEKQVDVLGVGAVTGDPLSGIEHENVEKDTGDFTAPHTDTWNGGEGDSLGQHEPVTNETGDLFTVSNTVEANKYIKKHGDKYVIVQKGTGKVLSTHDSEEKANASFRAMEMHKHEGAEHTADSSADLGGPMGEGIKGGPAKDGGPTWDSGDNGFPDHQPARVDLDAPLAEEVGAGTMTDPNEEFRSQKHAEPITSDGANDLGGPIGVAIAKAKEVQRKAFKLAETEIDLGLTDSEAKYDRIAELEGHSEESLDAQLATLSKVKTAGLKKSAPQKRTAGRMPSLRPVTAAFEIEAHSVSDQEIEDAIGW